MKNNKAKSNINFIQKLEVIVEKSVAFGVGLDSDFDKIPQIFVD